MRDKVLIGIMKFFKPSVIANFIVVFLELISFLFYSYNYTAYRIKKNQFEQKSMRDKVLLGIMKSFKPLVIANFIVVFLKLISFLFYSYIYTAPL